jgi:ABC-type nitrate/sulfonate/bicarbonate transport system ATPase subunit
MSKRPGKVKAIIDVDLPRPRELRSPAFFKIVEQVRELVIPEHDSL